MVLLNVTAKLNYLSPGEYFCPGQDHLEKMYLDETFTMNIDQVFEALFTDSQFFRDFVSSRKTNGQITLHKFDI